MRYRTKFMRNRFAGLGILLAWLAMAGQALPATDAVSSCVACHTHYGHLKRSLAKNEAAVSPLIEGMG